MWAWGNPADYPDSATGLAQSVRDFGIRYGISELADAEVPFVRHLRLRFRPLSGSSK
ncbi:DUF6882 domain-containing protein [Nocardia sp. NPDC055002]